MSYKFDNFDIRRREIASLRAALGNFEEELNFAKGIVPVIDRCYDNTENAKANCSQHGPFQQTHIWLEFKGRVSEKRSRCPECIQQEINQANSEAKSLETAILTEEAQIAERFTDCEFSNYEPVNRNAAQCLSLMKQYAAAWPDMLKNGTSLILSGKPGTGKNHLAVALAKDIIRNHQGKVLLTSVMRVVRAVRRTWGKESDTSEEELISFYTSRDLLIIDEVGIQYGSDSEMIILFDILNTRYEQILPTILISNLPPDEISGVIGERLTDRMVEGEGATLIFDWESYRRQKGKAAA